MKLSLARLEALVWVLIYAGLLVLAVGIALRASAPGLAAGAMACGSAGVLAGIVLIALRARRVRADSSRAATESSTPSS